MSIYPISHSFYRPIPEGVYRVPEGVVFCTSVFNIRPKTDGKPGAPDGPAKGSDAPAMLYLFCPGDAAPLAFPMEEEACFGHFRSLTLGGDLEGPWYYAYGRGDELLVDPLAIGLTPWPYSLPKGLYAHPLPWADECFPVPGHRAHIDWTKEIIYQAHPRGTTMGKAPGVRHHGTLLGLTELVPYLAQMGFTALELMPIMARAEEKAAPDYWNYTADMLRSIAPSLGSEGADPGSLKADLAKLMQALHDAGLKLILQIPLPKSYRAAQLRLAMQYWLYCIGVDALHPIGDPDRIRTLLQDETLCDAPILIENAALPAEPGKGILRYDSAFSQIVRRCYRGDHALEAFTGSFINASEGASTLHYIADFGGFTLLDLVSYEVRHNEANGERGLDGPTENLSMNGGVEGETRRKDVLTWRRQVIRGYLMLNFLTPGAPLLFAGDESYNTQGGNNNPYNQDNATGYTDWKNTKESRALTEFVRSLVEFRKAHPIFTGKMPYRLSDPKGTGFPDLSLHAQGAWHADPGRESGAIGFLFNERYCAADPEHCALYFLAVNFRRSPYSFGLPKLPAGTSWEVVFDACPEGGLIALDERALELSPQDVVLLKAPFPAEKRAK